MCFKLVSKEEINKNAKKHYSPSLIEDFFLEGMAIAKMSEKLLEKIKQQKGDTNMPPHFQLKRT
jgi:response regulator RpfG family c-di-GMP phosphodiesterase